MNWLDDVIKKERETHSEATRRAQENEDSEARRMAGEKQARDTYGEIVIPLLEDMANRRWGTNIPLLRRRWKLDVDVARRVWSVSSVEGGAWWTVELCLGPARFRVSHMGESEPPCEPTRNALISLLGRAWTEGPYSVPLTGDGG